jgi:hypothetical protein
MQLSMNRLPQAIAVFSVATLVAPAETTAAALGSVFFLPHPPPSLPPPSRGAPVTP